MSKGFRVAYYSADESGRRKGGNPKGQFDLREVTMLRGSDDETAPPTAIELSVKKHNFTLAFTSEFLHDSFLRQWVNLVPISAVSAPLAAQFHDPASVASITAEAYYTSDEAPGSNGKSPPLFKSKFSSSSFASPPPSPPFASSGTVYLQVGPSVNPKSSLANNFTRALLPVAFILLLPWLASVGFAQWPPPVPLGRLASELTSVSSFVSNPHSTLTIFFAFFYGLTPSYPLLSGSWQLPERYDRSTLEVVASTAVARRSLLLSWALLGASLALSFEWQPFVHVACRAFACVSAIVHLAGVAALLAFSGDAPISWDFMHRLYMDSPNLFFVFVVGIIASLIAVSFLPSLNGPQPPHLRIAFPGSPSDDNILLVSELCSIASLLLTWPLAAQRLDTNYAMRSQGQADMVNLLGQTSEPSNPKPSAWPSPSSVGSPDSISMWTQEVEYRPRCRSARPSLARSTSASAHSVDYSARAPASHSRDLV